MAEMKIEHTADAGGRDIVFRVHVHEEVFQWLTITAIMKLMSDQFKEYLEDRLIAIKEGQE